MNKKISVIIPAYNEEKYIGLTVESIIQWQETLEIIIVDDGSIDNTKQIIENLSKQYHNVKAVILDRNQGKGNALMAGIKSVDGEIIMFLDADLGRSATNAIKLIEPIINGSADMVTAVLPQSNKKAGFGLVKMLAKKGIFYFTGYRTFAPLSGQRAVKREVIRKISELKNGFGIEVGLTIDVLRNGFKIEEIELPLTHRETGRNIKGFIHRGKEFLDVLKAFYSVITSYGWRK